MALELSLFGGFIVSILPPLLWLPLQDKGFGAGGAGGQTISISSSDPPPAAVSLHCHTAVSIHTDWGPIYSVHHGTARGEELQAKPPPHSRSAHKETVALCDYSLLTTDKSGLSTGKVAEAGFEVP